MSIDTALGRIDEILAMRQQLMAPVNGVAATAAVTSTLPTSGSAAGGSASFSNALATAQAASGTAGSTTASATGVSDPRVQAMTTMANSLVGKPYVWGGGHAGFAPTQGYDCSGFVSAVLHAGGYLTQPADTTSLPSQPEILAGPGQFVTIYDRAQSGQTGHVIIEINGQFYESGGSAGSWGGGGGVERIGRPSDSYLASFPNVLHPSGL